MKFTFSILSALLMLNCLANVVAQTPNQQQLYEVRTYLLDDEANHNAIDDYLQNAYLPALARTGVGPVGVFSPSAADTNPGSRIIVVIPFADANQITQTRTKIKQDAEFRQASEAFLSSGNENPPYKRITSELLVAMDAMPKLVVPEGTLGNDDRVYELRLYESANERLGDLKVHMFNNGEVPIFLDSGIQPIFLGQGVLGPQTPNLTYLTVYPNDQARLKAWDTFRSHPDWQVLKVVPKYKGTVSKIDKYVLKAKPYSKM